MKKMSLITWVFLFLASCTTMQEFKTSDLKEDGIRYKYGSNKGVKVGDTVSAYKKKLSGGGKGATVSNQSVGSLTITRVESDYSIMRKNGEFEINEGISFDRD